MQVQTRKFAFAVHGCVGLRSRDPSIVLHYWERKQRRPLNMARMQVPWPRLLSHDLSIFPRFLQVLVGPVALAFCGGNGLSMYLLTFLANNFVKRSKPSAQPVIAFGSQVMLHSNASTDVAGLSGAPVIGDAAEACHLRSWCGLSIGSPKACLRPNRCS